MGEGGLFAIEKDSFSVQSLYSNRLWLEDFYEMTLNGLSLFTSAQKTYYETLADGR